MSTPSMLHIRLASRSLGRPSRLIGLRDVPEDSSFVAVPCRDHQRASWYDLREVVSALGDSRRSSWEYRRQSVAGYRARGVDCRFGRQRPKPLAAEVRSRPSRICQT